MHALTTQIANLKFILQKLKTLALLLPIFTEQLTHGSEEREEGESSGLDKGRVVSDL